MYEKEIIVESWLITNDDIDALSIFCALAIFISHPIAILWILWCTVPWINEPKSILDTLETQNSSKQKKLVSQKRKQQQLKKQKQKQLQLETNKQKSLASKTKRSNDDLHVINTSISIEQRPVSLTSIKSNTPNQTNKLWTKAKQ